MGTKKGLEFCRTNRQCQKVIHWMWDEIDLQKRWAGMTLAAKYEVIRMEERWQK